MRILVFLNELGLGGSGKAACHWTRLLHKRGHDLQVVSLREGPRRTELEQDALDVRIVAPEPEAIRQLLQDFRPEVIHAHAPGHPHVGDVLGAALAKLPRIPLVQTNIFGRFENPKENAWTDFRLFISWTSCVQAARRSFQRLDEGFFRNASVAVYPLKMDEGPSQAEIKAFRAKHGVQPDEVLLGRLSRPEPNKWTDLAIDSFRLAARLHPEIKLLLREPPPAIRLKLEAAPDRDRFVVLPATNDSRELTLTMASLDAVLHASIIGESFGYGIAEPMNLGKPVIVNSTPWQDQAQIELVRHNECGIIASNEERMADAISKFARDKEFRTQLGRNAKLHIRKLANPQVSVDRLEEVLQLAISDTPNPHAGEDLRNAEAAAKYLDEQQFGHTWSEQLGLRPFHYRVRFHELRHAIRSWLGRTCLLA